MAAENRSSSEASHPAPDAVLDHFARLGLPRRWAQDREAIDAAYLEASRACHPDRFAQAEESVRRAALEQASALNVAYAIVRDRVARAEYLVTLGGIDLDDGATRPGGATPDRAFLVEMLERREQLEERIARGEALDAALEGVEAELAGYLRRAVSALDAGDTVGAARILLERRYVRRLRDEIDAARTAAEGAAPP